MKKITITLLMLLLAFSYGFSQRVEPIFVWTNKSDYQINGETAVTFKPGQVVSYSIDYTLGSTDGVDDTGGFFLFGVQDEAEANKDVLGTGWANETIGGGNNYVYSAAGNYTVAATAVLSSSDANLTYRVLTYRAYTPNGGSIIYGGPGSSDPVLVYIRSQAEIDALLSTNDFNKNKLAAYYNTNLDAVVMDNQISGDYSIYDLTGRVISEGVVSNEISTASLKSGLYILATESGVLKFVK
jgi:hypothetical protein